MSYNTRGDGSGGAKILTTMKDFIILTKIGKQATTNRNKTDPPLLFWFISGDGAYSEVYKVKRNNDSQIYALKKVGKQAQTTNC